MKSRQKKKKKKIGIQQFKESKNKEEKNNSKRELIMIFYSPEVKNLLSLCSGQLDCIFSFYLSQMGKEIPLDGSINWAVYDKFSENFGMYSVVPQETNLSLFKNLTKKKTIETISFEEFKTILVTVAITGKNSLGFEDGAKAVEALFNRLQLNMSVKDLKTKLKSFQSFTNKEKKKKRGVGLNQEKSKKDFAEDFVRNQLNNKDADEKEGIEEYKDDLDQKSEIPDYKNLSKSPLENDFSAVENDPNINDPEADYND